jgi:iron complex outermembrane recepter protein
MAIFNRFVSISVLFAPQVLCNFASVAHAQSQMLPSITVEGKAAPVLEPARADVAGFGNAPVRALAQSVSVLSKDVLNETALTSLSQLTRLDASLSDAYNTTGYNQSLSVRGFLLDNVYNFRRDGLPVLNIGPLALENKSQIEVLKGVSGMLSGVSAPGGLVNATTQRATNQLAHGAQLSLGERGSLGASTYLGGRIAEGVNARIDASVNSLRPEIDYAKGQKHFLGAAFDARFGATKISLDLETQTFKQPSVPGASPLDTNGDGIGDALPAAQSRRNLNAQPWSQPFETQSTLAALKLAHAVTAAWTVNAAAQTQRVRTNDRIAFPDGCSNDATYVYPGFCGNGDYDLYDFRSENERRTLNVYDLHARGTHDFAGSKATLTLGAQQRDFKQRTQAQAYNYAGSGNLFSPQVSQVDAAPDATIAGTNLTERATELYANAHFNFNNGLNAFAGVRNARIERASIRTDGSEPFGVKQSVVTPWLGVSFAVNKSLNVYASWGQGAESEVVPNRPAQYTNYGAALPTLRSTQFEFGAKWQAAPRLLFTAAAFEIEKPFGDDLAAGEGVFTRVAGAKAARHRGLEFAAIGKIAPQVSVQASVALLDAQYTKALNESLIGKRVTNVPRVAGSVFVDYQFANVKGLAINALMSAQGNKAVSADNALKIGGGAQLDLGARYIYVGSGQRVTWRLNVENATNREAWREAPTQPWGGIYLLPSPARAVRASVAVDW